MSSNKCYPKNQPKQTRRWTITNRWSHCAVAVGADPHSRVSFRSQSHDFTTSLPTLQTSLGLTGRRNATRDTHSERKPNPTDRVSFANGHSRRGQRLIISHSASVVSTISATPRRIPVTVSRRFLACVVDNRFGRIKYPIDGELRTYTREYVLVRIIYATTKRDPTTSRCDSELTS